MSKDLERQKPAQKPYRPGAVPEPYVPKKPPPDPTEWRPRNNSGYVEEQVVVEPTHMESEPLRYGSLVEVVDGLVELGLIEQRALADLRQVMNEQRMHPDERSLRVRWQLVVEGYGFKAPEGFIHPEAPEDIQRQSQAAWKRCVEMATDSLAKMIFVRVWKKRAPTPNAIEEKKPIALPGPEG